MVHNDLIPINDILADVVQLVGDPEYKRGLTIGWYKRQIKEAVEELNLDTFMLQLTQDIPFPKENLIAELPSGLFNIRNIYIFSGACDEPVNIQKVWYRRNYNNSQGGANYTANRIESGNSDIIMPRDGSVDNLYTATPQNGNTLGFSSACNTFDWIRLEYNGFGGDIEEIPLVPRMCRQAVIDFTRVKALTAFASYDRSVLNILQYAIADKRKSWDDVMYRSKKMDKWIRDSYKEYLSRPNY